MDFFINYDRSEVCIMKKMILLSVIISILLGGCGQQTETDPYSNFYTKTFILASEKLEKEVYQAIDEWDNGEFSLNQISTVLTISSEKKFIAFLAERDLKYHFQYGSDKSIASAFSATTNLSYNISYLVNLPAKIKANYVFNKALVNGDVDGELSSMVSSILPKNEDISFGILMALDIFYTITGAILAIFMLIVGTIFGFLNHPIQTFTDIPSAFINLISGLTSAWTNFFEW